MENLYPYLWLILIVILILIEAATVSLTTIWLAGGALFALFFSMLSLPLYAQITVFLLISIILIIFTRPVAIKHLKIGKYKTNADLLIGQTGIVLKDIFEHKTGQVKVKGQIWTAVAESEDFIAADTEVVVKAIEGVKLVVISAEQ
ncbi:MAG: NfeD family protein [Clostridiaceae bacterium]|jgi:membrane protein implicated in regulation of membrane protease activity|nr:NfeD family protein [Clostridiaceae bacterium]